MDNGRLLSRVDDGSSVLDLRRGWRASMSGGPGARAVGDGGGGVRVMAAAAVVGQGHRRRRAQQQDDVQTGRHLKEERGQSLIRLVAETATPTCDTYVVCLSQDSLLPTDRCRNFRNSIIEETSSESRRATDVSRKSLTGCPLSLHSRCGKCLSIEYAKKVAAAAAATST